MAHGWKPQWRNVVAMADCARFAVVVATSPPCSVESLMTPETSSPGRGSTKWDIGSVTPKKTRPIPMPAAKRRANQDMSENSGSSSGRPSLMSPFFDSPSATQNTTKAKARNTYHQPKLEVIHDVMDSNAARMSVGQMMVTADKPTTITAVGQKTHLTSDA